jgi:hypothetical protein
MAHVEAGSVSPNNIPVNILSGIKDTVYSFADAIRGSAALETLIFLTIAVSLDLFAGDGTRFINAPLHPFWIIILLVTVQYGINEAIMAALLSSAFLLIGNLPEQGLMETMYEYVFRVTYLPFLWFAAALTLGSLRSRQLLEKEHLQEELKQLKSKSSTLMEGYKTMKQLKEKLEVRLAEENCSVLTAYNIARSLECVTPGDIDEKVITLIRMTLKPIKFSLYEWKDNSLKLDTTYGWSRFDNYRRQFDMSTPLAKCIVGKKHLLSVVNAEDEVYLGTEGILAGPIINDITGKIYGMLKIEDIGFTDLGLRTHEIFHTVCEWIAQIYANMEKHQAYSKKAAFVENADILRIPDGLQHSIIYSRPEPMIAA